MAPPLPLLGTVYTVPRDRTEVERLLQHVGKQYDVQGRGLLGSWIGYIPTLALVDAECIKEVIGTRAPADTRRHRVWQCECVCVCV
jgi:hypothetical protein